MYLDSAIIVKLLIDEPDTKLLVTALVGQPLSSSELSVTEVLSALLGKERNKLISFRQRKEAWQTFNERVQAREIVLHPLNGVVLRKANHVLERCHPVVPLRTLDAIHTATCDLIQDFPLCATDKRMRDAAGVLGIPVFPVDEEVKR
ncbi:MAG: type II toxin-antitoxin system VapC family toxin [Chthoniobacteraceae bacterium]